MRRLLRLLGLLLLLAIALAAAVLGVVWVLGPPTYEQYSPEAFTLERKGDAEAGKRLVTMLCVRCHYDPQSNTLAGRALAPAFDRYGQVHAANLTQDDVRGIAHWTDADRVMLLRSGVHPQRHELMPPYMPWLPGIADTDLADLLAYLRGDDPWVQPSRKADPPTQLSFEAIVRSWTIWEPGPQRASTLPRPDDAEPIALGAYLANDLLQCHGCHSASLDRVDWLYPSHSEGFYAGGTVLRDLAGHPIVGPGLTAREDGGLGAWSFEEFRRALVEGEGPQGEVLRWPMPRYGALTEAELTALYAYLRTLPPATTAPKRPAPYKVVTDVVDPGRHQFERLGCPSCHGAKAQGFLSLDDAPTRFPTDPQLAAYISDPAFVDEHAWMPAYGHLLDDAQMADLCEYVRRLAEHGPHAAPPK